MVLNLKVQSAAALCWILVACCCMASGVTNLNPKVDKMKLVVDTDGGPDDAMAILILLANQNGLSIDGITTVSGNTGVMNATRNVLLTLEAGNSLNIPVYPGSVDPLLKSFDMFDHFFGFDGFGDYPFPPVKNSSVQATNAAVYLANLVKANPGQITIMAIGPLTNIALAAHLYPKFLSDIKRLVIMGGTYQGGGNVRPGVEFNIYMDPEAAHYVFSKTPQSIITLLPLEPALQTSFPMKWRMETLATIKSKKVDLINKAERLSLNGTEWICYDQLAAAALVDPKFVMGSTQSRPIVEVAGDYGRGLMVHNYDEHWVTVVTSVSRSKLKTLLVQALS